MSVDDSELKELAAQAVAGDAHALSALCQRLETPVFALCLRMLGNVRDAEDAAQDVLVKVVTQLARFEGRSALLTWVHQIAARHVLAAKKSRSEEHRLDEDSFGAMLESGLAFGATQAPLTPEDRALRSEVRLSCTQGMLLMLSRDERLALVLVDLLGFDAAEAAEIAQVSHDSMRQRLSRARVRLGDFLRARCGLANSSARCQCDRQIAAKKSLGMALDRRRYAPLATGDLPERNHVALASAELRAVSAVGLAFNREGEFQAPASLRTRLEQLLPTVLGAPPSAR